MAKKKNPQSSVQGKLGKNTVLNCSQHSSIFYINMYPLARRRVVK